MNVLGGFYLLFQGELYFNRIALFHYCCYQCPQVPVTGEVGALSPCLLCVPSIQRNSQKVNMSRSGIKKMLIKALVLGVSACR